MESELLFVLLFVAFLCYEKILKKKIYHQIKKEVNDEFSRKISSIKDDIRKEVEHNLSQMISSKDEIERDVHKAISSLEDKSKKKIEELTKTISFYEKFIVQNNVSICFLREENDERKKEISFLTRCKSLLDNEIFDSNQRIDGVEGWIQRNEESMLWEKFQMRPGKKVIFHREEKGESNEIPLQKQKGFIFPRKVENGSRKKFQPEFRNWKK